MTDEPELLDQAVADCVHGIVCAYVAKNRLPVSDLPALIASVRAAVWTLAAGEQQALPAPDLRVTEAQIRKSIMPDALISFINGKPYKTLKRHLSVHGLNPFSYRTRYGLPLDYPMAASSYRTLRSTLAKGFDFGISNRPGSKKAD